MSSSDFAGQWPILDEAHEILRSAVAGVPADGWGRATPCSAWNVAQVVEHATLDQLLYVSSLTGAAKPDADAFQPTGDLAADPIAFLHQALRASREAFEGVAADAQAVTVPLPPFSVPAAIAVGAAALDAAVHGWDVAAATGQQVTFSAPLARELYVAATQLVEPLRAWGAYAAAIQPPADSDDVTRLLCYLGRDPGWTS